MRVIAGEYRRRTLRSLPGLDIRPTADRLRETLFNVLCAGNPEALAASTWIDLYAGTGAVGIEALSRGARIVRFVESSKAAADLISANLTSLGIARGFQIVRRRRGESTAAIRGGICGCRRDRFLVSRPSILNAGGICQDARVPGAIAIVRRPEHRDCRAPKKFRSGRILANCGATESWCKETRR